VAIATFAIGGRGGPPDRCRWNARHAGVRSGVSARVAWARRNRVNGSALTVSATQPLPKLPPHVVMLSDGPPSQEGTVLVPGSGASQRGRGSGDGWKHPGAV